MQGRKRKEHSDSKGDTAIRASISFPLEVYRTLEEIADKQKVSLAWVVRDAAEKYIEDRWPLLTKGHES